MATHSNLLAATAAWRHGEVAATHGMHYTCSGLRGMGLNFSEQGRLQAMKEVRRWLRPRLGRCQSKLVYMLRWQCKDLDAKNQIETTRLSSSGLDTWKCRC